MPSNTKQENMVIEWSVVAHWNDGTNSWLSDYLFNESTNKDILETINSIWQGSIDNKMIKGEESDAK